MYWIEIYSAGHTRLEKVPALAGQLLYDILQRQGITFPHSCHGMGHCKQCRVTVQKKGSTRKNAVLSCRYKVDSSLKVFLPYLPDINIPGKKHHKARLKSPLRTARVPTPRKTIPGGIIPYLHQETKKKVKEANFFHHSLPSAFQEQNHLDLQTTSRHIWSADINRKYVILCDFGTTTVTCRKVAIQTGNQETHVFSNPQIKFGADIISRINFCMQEPQHFSNFQKENQLFLSRIIEALQLTCEDIFCFIVAGNSVMEYFLRGYSPLMLGYYPFNVTWYGDEWHYENQLLWYYFPLVTGFIGGDLIAGLYGIHADKEDDFLFIDIGTNGEIALCVQDQIHACSCAAGPALEGGNIENGGPAITGAVYRLDNDGFKTIGDVPPRTFCGSGIIDFIWLAYCDGILNNEGSIVTRQSDLFGVKDDAIFYRSLPEMPIRQQEIRHIQSAKAAFWSSVKILLEHTCANKKIPAKVYIGGGFSYSLNIKALQELHFFPEELFSSRILPSPYPVMEGLTRFYEGLNRTPERTLQKIVSRIQPLDLANHPRFEEYFLKGMFLCPNTNAQ